MIILLAFLMALLGICVGIVNGALGLGGGILMVPAFMTLLPGVDMHTAKGTSLFIILFIAIMNSWRLHSGAKEIPWHSASFLAIGSVVGSYASAYVTSMMPERLVVLFFLVVLVLLGVKTFFLKPPEKTIQHARHYLIVSLLIGLITGIIGGATGTGGGMVLVPLVLYYGISTNSSVVGLSNLVMVATSFAGSIAHLQAEQAYDAAFTWGHVYLIPIPFVFLGAQLGSRYGLRWNGKLTLRIRSTILGALLLLIAARMLYRLSFGL